ncbi:MAG: hypothetical protein GX791_02865 [Synergistaceae bacterium]|nr:hypothetical protein [Synergistaceae bacterium]
MKKHLLIDAALVLFFIALSMFLYSSGKGYALIFENRDITIGGSTYQSPGYIRITMDKKGRPLEIMEKDRDIMTVKGKKHIMEVEVLDEDEETVLSTVERPIVIRYDRGNLLSIPAFLAENPEWNLQIDESE